MSDQPRRPAKNHDIALLRKAFGQALVALRENRGITQLALARLVDTPRTHLWRMEIGRDDPSLSMLWRLSRALNVSPLEIVEEVLAKFYELKKHLGELPD